MMKVTLPEKKQLRKKEKCNFVFLDKDLQLAKGLLFTIFYSVWISFLQIVPYFYVLILIWDWVTLVSFLVFKDLSKVKDHKQGKRKGFCKENLPDRWWKDDEKNEPQEGNWRCIHQIKLPYTYIIQSWPYKDKNVDIKHLCP